MPLSCQLALQKIEELRRIKREFDVLVAESFGSFTYLPKTRVARIALERRFEDIGNEIFGYNREKARAFGLEERELAPYAQAQELLDAVISGALKMDNRNLENKKKFVERWRAEMPELPLPCAPETNGYLYLEQLSKGAIVKNIDGDLKPCLPQFDKKEDILIEEWIRHPSALGMESPLLEALALKRNIIANSRKDIDAALWSGDPGLRLPTKRHREILEEMGCDPHDHEIRLMRQDEYARLSIDPSFNPRNLQVHLDGYFKDSQSQVMGQVMGLIAKKPLLSSDPWAFENNIYVERRQEIFWQLAACLVIAPKELP